MVVIEKSHELIVAHENEKVFFVEVVCSELPPEFQNKSIHDLIIHRFTGANIVGFKTPGRKYIINPGPNAVLL